MIYLKIWSNLLSLLTIISDSNFVRSKVAMSARYGRIRAFAKSLAPLVLTMILMPSINAQEPIADFSQNNVPMEEVVVEGQLPEIDDMNRFEVVHYYNANARGGALYKMRRYDDAKPFLEVGAQLGFKMSQARLGAIYAYGLGTTERDAVKGITWIGVAAEHRTDPTIRKQYTDLLKQVPESAIPRIQELVSEGRAKYGSSATGTKCQMIRSAGSHMSWLECEVKDVYRFRSAADKYNLCLIQGIESIQSEASGGETGIGAIPVTPCI